MHVIKSLGVFALALALLAYIPGRLVLRMTRLVVAPLEAVALSLNLGLILSAFLYWFLGYFSFREYFVFWPLAAAGVSIFYWRREWSWPGCYVKGPQLLLFGTILFGVFALTVSPVCYPNMTVTQNGGMRLCPLFDAPFHAAIANELTHSIPPKNPIFSGQVFKLPRRC